MALHRVWVDARTMIALEDSVMTWMKAGEFECENGSKAVVLGRVPDPNDTPKYPWTGYVVTREPNGVKTTHMKISWSDEGKTNCYPQYSLKPPVQVRYMALSPAGDTSCWYHSWKAAAERYVGLNYVIAVEFCGETIVNPQNIRVFLPDGPNTWKQMGLSDLRVTTILAPNGSWTCEQKVEEACDCGHTPPA